MGSQGCPDNGLNGRADVGIGIVQGTAHADAFSPSRDLPDSLLKPIHGLRRNRTLDLRASRKTEPEKLPPLRSCHLRLIHLELAAVSYGAAYRGTVAGGGGIRARRSRWLRP